MPKRPDKSAAPPPPKTVASNPPQEKALPEEQGRPIIYPDRYAEFHDGNNAVTAEKAKAWMGWTEDQNEAAQLGLGEALFKYKSYAEDKAGIVKKVWCKNDIENRPFYIGNATGLMQEQLNKRWAGPNGSGKPTAETPDGETLNPEPIIISKVAQVHNGQHQLIAVALAQNELIGPNKYHWEEHWPDGIIKIDKLVVFGISDSDAVINTMDTCKPRSLSDVIYRSPYFKDKSNKDRVSASKMSETAVKLQWERLGLKLDAWAPRRTHAESVDFIQRHERLLECVLFILDNNREGALRKFIQPGYAAGLMYLMAAANTDPDEYHTQESPSEEHIDFTLHDKAMAFWKSFMSGPEMQLAREEIGWLEDEDTMKGATLSEREAIIIKAWNCFKEDIPLTKTRLKLKYENNEDTGISRLLLDTSLVCGGIDLGKPKEKVVPEDEDEAPSIFGGDPDDGDAEEDEAPPPPSVPVKPNPALSPKPDPNGKLKSESPFSPEERAKLLAHIPAKPDPKPAKKKGKK